MIKSILTKSWKSISNRYIVNVCKREYLNPPFSISNERPIEYAFVFENLKKYYPSNILDVGTGTTALPHLLQNCGLRVSAIDNIRDYWGKDMVNRHFHVIDDDITKSKLTGKYDFITCISVLEHIVDYDGAVANMFNLLNPDGLLLLTFPYNENKYINNVYELPESTYGKNFPFIAQAFSKEQVKKWLKINDATIMEQEYWKFWSGEYWTEGEKIIPPERTNKNELHQISCLLLKKG